MAEELGRRKNVYESADLAFWDLPRQHDGSLWKDLSSKYHLEIDEYATMVISGIQGRYYTNDRNAYFRTWRGIISGLIKNPNFGDRKICLLAHAFGRHGDEETPIREFLQGFNADEARRIVPITDRILPTRARLVLGNGLFAVTERMHAAVSTFQMGEPAISLSYSEKYAGVLGENLGRDDLIIEANVAESWRNGYIESQVLDRIEYLLQNRARIIPEISAAVEKQKSLLSRSFFLCEQIMNGYCF